MSTHTFDNLHIMSTPMQHGEYTQVLRKYLPKSAFKRSANSLVVALFHIMVFFCGLSAIHYSTNSFIHLMFSVVMGHSLACLGFLTHDLSHGSILAKGYHRNIIEVALFTLNAISTTMWRKTHNKLHHFHTNMLSDPDRKFTEQELNRARLHHSTLFWPNRASTFTRPFVFLKFVTYLASQTLGAITPASWRPMFVANKAALSKRERLQVVLEITIILAFWSGVYFYLDQQWLKFFWAIPVPLAVSSSVLMMYIQTNHSLNPLLQEADPVRSSVSVIVPRLFNILHDNISYHTEHHLYPRMNPKYYPLVTELLKEHFPNRYNRIPLSLAWSRLWQSNIYLEEDLQKTEKVFQTQKSPH